MSTHVLCFVVCHMQMLFQACQVSYSNQSLWTDDAVHLFHTQSLDLSSFDSSLRLIFTIIDCMINMSLLQVACSILVSVSLTIYLAVFLLQFCLCCI